MPLSDRDVCRFRRLCIVVLFTAAALYMAFTIHWPWMWDTQIMHYAVFLTQHGKTAYRDIYDMNMPGCYLVERWAIDIFGGGDLGWRFYEFALLGSMTFAASIIARPYDWMAGLLAGVLFAIFHGVDGGAMATERDEVITVLLLIGYAFQFLAIRKKNPLLMVPFGLSMGLAISMKPTVALFPIALFLFAFFALKQRSEKPFLYIVYCFAGFGVVLAILLSFLLPHSLGAFLAIERIALPYYSNSSAASWGYLIRNSLPRPFLFILPASIVLALANRGQSNWEIWAVRVGVLLGALAYFVQRKGYTYHRYPFMAFVLLWFGLECAVAMKAVTWRRTLGALSTAVAVLLVLPPKVNELRHERHNANPFADQLQVDLRHLGGSALQGRVQCLDLATGCYSALYRLGLVQSTGFIGDLPLFAPDDGHIVSYSRTLFWNQIHENPPKVIVLSSEWFGTTYSFDKLDAWPQFRDYLNSAYTVYTSHSFGSFDNNVLAYRIYVLKQGSSPAGPS
ncbi:MAG TPA: glycosyltransferase family 39 protein [Acidobacteriaceae bacterium]|nr:glycosyltransferase family 39 protein [Acidobacteriaceae bacterium]